MSDWALPDDACELLKRLTLEEEPDLIVEAGSGRSTCVFAEALHALGAGKVVALEHDPHYAAATEALLPQDVRSHAEVRLAPLEPHGQDLLAPNWYARSAWADLEGIGLLLVDGPPGSPGRYTRQPALPLLRDRLLPNCLVILDDTDRPDEQTILRDWKLPTIEFVHAEAALSYGRLAC